jgi:spore germination protein YaaH
MPVLRAVAIALLALTQFAALPASRPAAAVEGHQLQSSIWLPYWLPSAVNDVSAHAERFRTASLFWWQAASCSSVRREPGAGSQAAVRRLRANGLQVVATVVGSGLPPRKAIRCFSDPARRTAHVNQLVRLAERGHYAGIDIDYETLAHTTRTNVALRVRAAFSRFVNELCDALRAHGKRCIVTVMPRIDDSTHVWLGKVIPGVYDYGALAVAADRLRVMAYDQHSRRFGPGPIAGYPWVKRVIAYTASKTPLEKVELGIPLYGRDFAHGDSTSLSSDQARAIARTRGIKPRFDRAQREATFRYRANGVRHTVWFSSARAVATRTRLAAASGMAGAAYWAATYELPGTWKAVRHAAR